MKHLKSSKYTYSADKLSPFIDWFYNTYKDKMNEEGWIISYAQALDIPNTYKTEYWNRSDDFWQIQKNDQYDILEDDMAAEKLAKNLGLYIDDYGIVIGYNGVSFLEHPEEIEIYKDIKKYNL